MAWVHSAVLPMLIAYPHFWHQFLTAWAARLGSTVIKNLSSSVVFQRGDAAHICCQASPRDGGPPATARNAAYNRHWLVSAAAQARGKSRTRFSSVECGIMYLCKSSLISSKQYLVPRKLIKKVWTVDSKSPKRSCSVTFLIASLIRCPSTQWPWPT